MILKEFFYGIKCDLCEDVFENGEGYSFLVDQDHVEASAMVRDWFIGCIGERKIKRHYCPKCHHINDDDKLILTPTESK